MSLDVYLKTDVKRQKPAGRIFVREEGKGATEISRAEWDRRFPGREPVTMGAVETNEVYSDNITHNLGGMANAAGIYKELWRPDEIGVTKASQLIEPLRQGLALLKSDRPRFETFNARNGWGKYETFVSFVANYLAACEEYPEADVSVSR